MSKKIEGKVYLSPYEVAKIVGVSHVTVWRRCKNGLWFNGKRVPILRNKLTRRYYIPRQAVVLWQKEAGTPRFEII